ncbi:hypothetical protein U9M48_034274 [Paspalum notatum var. saurae]|uniref:F-box domain-containing protein n=1 Tax=Paspalum notatum var. saurae TaxID=547442 RepID=A0AAQ3X7C3_PASNO
MDKTARRSSTTASIKHLPESIIIWDILVHLPTKDVLRCRAVCKSWRRWTSTRDFALAHHQRQPLLPLIQHFEEEFERYWDFEKWCDDGPRFMVLRNHNLFPIVRCSTPGGAKLKVHGACDGFLLISYTDTSCLQERHRHFYYVCNPATRQSTGLNWQLTDFIQVVGFYGHSSGEYRVLYCLPMEHSKTESVDGKLLEFSTVAEAELVEYYILTLGSNEPRCLGGPPPETLPSLYGVWIGLEGYFKAPVLYRGCLHWGSDSTYFSVFDTVAETFRSMLSPSHQLVTDLFLLETKGHLDLCAASVGVTVMELWVLQDYEAELWNLKFKIGLLSVVAPPWRDKVLESSSTRTLRAVVLGDNELLVQVRGRMLLCDTAGRLRNVKPDKGNHTLQIAWHWYRESMVPPPVMQPAFPVMQSPFLLGV